MSQFFSFPLDKVKVEEVILVSKERRGKGVEGDPIRCITQVFLKTGELISENDPQQMFTQKNMEDFALYVSNTDNQGKDVRTLFKMWNS